MRTGEEVLDSRPTSMASELMNPFIFLSNRANPFLSEAETKSGNNSFMLHERKPEGYELGFKREETLPFMKSLIF